MRGIVINERVKIKVNARTKTSTKKRKSSLLILAEKNYKTIVIKVGITKKVKS
jgi:hypothetical protein